MQGNRVATYALRDSADSYEELHDDLERVIEKVAPDVGRAIVIGESFGGTVALSFTLAHPERVSALVVLNSFAHFEPQVRLRAAIVGLSILPWGAMRAVRQLDGIPAALAAHPPRRDSEFIELTAAATWNGYRNRLRLLRRYDVRSRLHEITRPTLFLAAECDRLIPSVEQAKLMSARVSGAAMRVLQGHGHICLINDDVDLERILRTALFPGGTPTLRVWSEIVPATAINFPAFDACLTDPGWFAASMLNRASLRTEGRVVPPRAVNRCRPFVPPEGHADVSIRSVRGTRSGSMFLALFPVAASGPRRVGRRDHPCMRISPSARRGRRPRRADRLPPVHGHAALREMPLHDDLTFGVLSLR